MWTCFFINSRAASLFKNGCAYIELPSNTYPEDSILFLPCLIQFIMCQLLAFEGEKLMGGQKKISPGFLDVSALGFLSLEAQI